MRYINRMCDRRRSVDLFKLKQHIGLDCISHFYYLSYRQKLTVKIDSICECMLVAVGIWYGNLCCLNRQNIPYHHKNSPYHRTSNPLATAGVLVGGIGREEVTQDHRNLQTGSYWRCCGIAGQVSMQPTASYIDLDVLGN